MPYWHEDKLYGHELTSVIHGRFVHFCSERAKRARNSLRGVPCRDFGEYFSSRLNAICMGTRHLGGTKICHFHLPSSSPLSDPSVYPLPFWGTHFYSFPVPRTFCRPILLSGLGPPNLGTPPSPNFGVPLPGFVSSPSGSWVPLPGFWHPRSWVPVPGFESLRVLGTPPRFWVPPILGTPPRF